MISKKLHKKLISQWKGKQYQNRNKRVLQRLSWFHDNAFVLRGKHVLELGCNAAILAIEVMKYAKSYVGIEKKSVYHKQALKTIEVAELNPRFVSALKYTVQEFEEDAFKYNALILSRVLYHFSEEEVKLVEDICLPKVDIVMVVSGAEEKKGVRHNDRKFWIMQNMIDFFLENGFRLSINYKNKKFYAGIARRVVGE